MMAARRWATIVVGLLLALFGTVFALQGANVLKGSPVMSGNSTYIYVGAVLVILGLVLVVAGAASKPKRQ
jgi:tetrahydromethanopterin S-methyltransferase subunit C